jgi:putative transposase
VDTNGLIRHKFVLEASLQDQNGGKVLLTPLKGRFPRLKHIWADRGYNKGGFAMILSMLRRLDQYSS